MEIINEKDLKRYAVISWEDIILFDSDDLLSCHFVYMMNEGYTKGIYDYKINKYLDIDEVIDTIIDNTKGA